MHASTSCWATRTSVARPETHAEEGVDTEEVEPAPGDALAHPLQPKPVFCELCELTRPDSHPDGVPAADEELSWKEIARCAAQLYPKLNICDTVLYKLQ